VTLVDEVSVLANLAGKPVDDWSAGDLVAAYVLRLPTQRAADAFTDCYCFRPRSAGDAKSATPAPIPR
jgi:hypothetical protein